MLGRNGWWTNVEYWWSESAEDELFLRMLDNCIYPFEDLGNGFYYLQVRTGRTLVGFFFIVFAVLLFCSCVIYIGYHEIPLMICVFALFVGLFYMWATFCMQEIIISRLSGYLHRIKYNQRIICEEEIHNIYIRMESIIDSNRHENYCIVVGGYLLDEVRISRYSRNIVAMRLLAARLARNLGINYFDMHDFSYEHIVFNTRGHSSLRWNKHDVATIFEQYNPFEPDSIVDAYRKDIKVEDVEESKFGTVVRKEQAAGEFEPEPPLPKLRARR